MKNTPDAPRVEMIGIDELKPSPRIARLHPKSQILAIARNIETFGFNVPVAASADNEIIAGHARLEAARVLGLALIPVIRLAHLTPEQARAFAIADNRLAELGKWDERVLGEILLELSAVDLDFSLEVTGFTMAEIDLKIEALDSETDGAEDDDDLSQAEIGPAVSQPGDLWILGEHRINCKSALEREAYQRLMGDRRAAMVFADPPYNVPINGHVSGKGRIKHREFPMASGEMPKAVFTSFLYEAMRLAAEHSRKGALHYWCMDWRHLDQLLAAAQPIFGELTNLCVWVKDKPGMGSFYRSAHELVSVFKLGQAAHRNNVQLGRYGRNRTNVWRYPAPSHFGGGEDDALAALHPTVKPIALVADAILDASARRDIILDPFLGSGSTLLAAERVGRICYGIEIDPLYVDLAIRRWRLMTGEEAVHAETGQTFAEAERAREGADAA